MKQSKSKVKVNVKVKVHRPRRRRDITNETAYISNSGKNERLNR